MNALTRWPLAVVAAAGLGIDAFTHLDLASRYQANTTGTVNEAVLFQIEAALAIVAGLWILLRPGLLSAGCTLLVAGAGAFALLLYHYVDVGKIGPIPNMYDPGWFTEKKWSLAGELIAIGAGGVLMVAALASHRASGRASRRAGVRPSVAG
jgi:hypothetical protein